jgi:type II secretory ATPase GspE/PulE/Tfp pilus assembly ATPase PilB-like protein
MPRLMDMGCEAFLIVSTLNVVIGQRLVRKLLGDKEEYFLTDAEIKSLGEHADLDMVLKTLKEENIVPKGTTFEKVPFYRPKPSPESGDGYKGRVGIHEVLKMSATIRELIMQGKTSADIEVQARKEGMLTMMEDGIFKAAEGVTTIEEVLRVISE